jgi:signal transduction histidine kinase
VWATVRVVSPQEDEARLAAVEERNRIVREVHDVLAHSISVMTVQASAVRRLLTPEQEREREALRAVEETGRQALAEMRRLLAIMRDENEVAARSPAPGIHALQELVESLRGAGAPVELLVEGTPVPLPAGVELSAYRIVQEALDGDGQTGASVVVRYGDDDVEIEVTSDAGTTGKALAGARERAAHYGGTLECGPRPGGGFRVTARLPVREDAP